jgi:hypothetical protein
VYDARCAACARLTCRTQAICKACPRALVNIISNPVNSTVPIAAEVFKKAGTYDPRRLFGARRPCAHALRVHRTFA